MGIFDYLVFIEVTLKLPHVIVVAQHSCICLLISFGVEPHIFIHL